MFALHGGAPGNKVCVFDISDYRDKKRRCCMLRNTDLRKSAIIVFIGVDGRELAFKKNVLTFCVRPKERNAASLKKSLEGRTRKPPLGIQGGVWRV
jgi:hypothetical protein